MQREVQACASGEERQGENWGELIQRVSTTIQYTCSCVVYRPEAVEFTCQASVEKCEEKFTQ